MGSKPEESVLLWMLFQLTLDTSWQETYAWNGELDRFIQAVDNSDSHLTSQQFTRFFQGASISKVLWSTSENFWLLQKLRNANLQYFSNQLWSLQPTRGSTTAPAAIRNQLDYLFSYSPRSGFSFSGHRAI